MPQLSPTIGFLFFSFVLISLVVVLINLKSSLPMKESSSSKSFNKEYFF